MPRKIIKKTTTEPASVPVPATSTSPSYYSSSAPRKNWTNTVLVTLLIVASFIIGTLWQKLQQKESTPPTAGTQAQGQQAPAEVQVTLDAIKEVFKKDVLKFGDANKKVLFIAVEDPSCPYCAIASGKNPSLNTSAGGQFTLVADGGTYVAPVVEMKKLVDSGKASFAYIYSPGHGNGEMGTKAMYCAYEKGLFWQVHDKLMTAEGYDLLNNTVKNDKTKAQVLADFLKNEMNSNDLVSCLSGGKYDGRLASDTQIARSLGVNGTPGFFVNTTRFAGAYSYTDMQPSVEQALK